MKRPVLSEVVIILFIFFIFQFSITTVAATATEAPHVVPEHALYLPLITHVDEQPRPGAEATSTPPAATPNAPDHAEVVSIPAGAFQMGCDSANPGEAGCTVYDWQAREQPLHSVNLDAYYIDRYEVTNARYQACVAAGGCTPPARVDSWTRTDYYDNPAFAAYPVIYVTWQQASTFCAWEGKRLPTEAEWEKAARGADDTRKYPWGNAEPTCAIANFYDHTTATGCTGDTDRVGARPNGASPYGVMDMAGNVWEWVNDRYAEGYYTVAPPGNPQGPASGASHLLRGGAWDFQDFLLRTAFRYGSIAASYSAGNAGFRCVHTQW